MPGVQVSTATRNGPSVPVSPVSGQWFVTGQAERGRIDRAVLLLGMADFDLYFGARVTYGFLYDAVKLFFDEGGSQCYVSRVVGPAATTGTHTFLDRAGSPLSTLRVDANSPGAWSANVTVAVLAGLISGTFRMQVAYNGVIVEDYNNLVSPADAASKMSVSNYVVVTDLASATVSPNNIPALIAATALSAGTDDRASIVTSHYTTALTLFTKDLGVGAVSIPGVGSSNHAALVAHAVANNRVALLATARAATKSDLLSLSGTQTSEFCALFAPWIVVSDGAGGTRAVSPEPAVAAKRSQAHVEGSWIIPAGQAGELTSALDLDQIFITSDCDDLDTAHISMFRKIYGSIRLYGYRSMATDQINYHDLNIRDLMNFIADACGRALEQYVFNAIDGNGALFTKVNTTVVGVLDPIAAAGGLYALNDDDGVEIDPGYKVDTGSSVNTTQSIGNNQALALATLRPSPNAGTVGLRIVRIPFNQAV